MVHHEEKELAKLEASAREQQTACAVPLQWITRIENDIEAKGRRPFSVCFNPTGPISLRNGSERA